jgi:hypothetical protein
MDFNTTIDIIIKDLREAREIVDDLKKYPGVPQIQIELAKSKCRSAEEIMALLKTMKPDHLAPHDKGVEGVERVEGVGNSKNAMTDEPVIKDTLFEINDEEAIESSLAPTRGEEATEVVNLTVNKKLISEESTVIPKSSKEKLQETNIVADQFSGMSHTFYEQSGNMKSDTDISEVLKSRPVNDLTEAIGINDRFLFVREIFNGDQVSYNEAIAKLNKVDSLTDAKAVIMSYTGEGEESEAVTQLIDLVKRKLPADE